MYYVCWKLSHAIPNRGPPRTWSASRVCVPFPYLLTSQRKRRGRSRHHYQLLEYCRPRDYHYIWSFTFPALSSIELRRQAVEMVELRKRKAPAESLSAEKKAKVVEKAISKTQSRGSDKQAGASRADPSPVRSGDTIPLDGFGGEIETNEGVKTTLKTLVDSSKSGVVIFTYPRASTPGCKLTFLSP